MKIDLQKETKYEVGDLICYGYKNQKHGQIDIKIPLIGVIRDLKLGFGTHKEYEKALKNSNPLFRYIVLLADGGVRYVIEEDIEGIVTIGLKNDTENN